MKFKPIYIFHFIMPIILIHLMVHIKIGVNASCCCCDSINSSFTLDKNLTYKDTFLSVMYSPIIVPTLYITKPLIKAYIEKKGAEIYQDGNIFFYAGFCLDNQKDDIKKYKDKPVNHFDSYNFSYLYFIVVLNIIVSYLIWVYIFIKLKIYKKTKRILLGIFISLLPFLYFMYIMSIDSIDSVSYIEYIKQYSEYKKNDFLIE